MRSSGTARQLPDTQGKAWLRVRRRRWPRILGMFAALLVLCALLASWFLQPTRLTALILARASNTLHLELHTTGPGSYALRPEPRLVLPGLSAAVPGANAPFFRSGRVELALPWDTLRGRSADISSIVVQSPDIDLPALRSWLATQPPSTEPFKLPTLTRGLHIDDGLLRSGTWRVEHFNAALPSLADGKPTTLDASGNLLRGGVISKFTLKTTATPAGIDSGLRIDGAHVALSSDGELPSLTAVGSMRTGDAFSLDLAGAIEHAPRWWAESVDSSFGKPGDTPFSIVIIDGTTTPGVRPAAAATSAQPGLRLQLRLGDARRQPTLTAHAEASSAQDLDVALHGQLSRWPDAWPGLPPALAANADPILFDAGYHGSIFLGDPVGFDVKRAGVSLQGRFRLTDVRAWIKTKFAALLPPVEATLTAPQIDISGMQLRGVQMEIRDDAAVPTHRATIRASAPVDSAR